MKNLWIFGAAAVLSLAACSKNIDPEDPGAASGTKGDLYMTMTITPTGSIGTRTATPNQGSEVGKDRENTISSALVILAEETTPGSGVYKKVTNVFAGSAADTYVSGSGKNYTATFAMDRDALLKDISGTSTPAADQKKTYSIFVIANPTTTIANAFEGTVNDIQQTFEMVQDSNTDANSIWRDDNFLMSNSELATKEIDAAKIQPGTYTTRDDAFPLGTVKIQRAMSRFDLATASAYTQFTVREDVSVEDGSPENGFKELTVTFDALAMVNMAQKAYLFKQTAESFATLGSKTMSFENDKDDANKTHWAFSPDQTAYTSSLFTGFQSGSQKDLASFFGTNSVYGGYTTISSLTEPDNNYERPGGADTDLPEYSIWRYCMENTNPDVAANQKNGNSTGIVFRAVITGQKVDGSAINGADGPIYAYNSVILGTAEGLKAYATSAKKSDKDKSGVYDAVKMKYAQAFSDAVAAGETGFVAGEKKEDGTWADGKDPKYGELSLLDKYLVKQGFSIYRPESDNNYYCYYIYWNRHNDNGKNTIMGPMEFATVRNNIYKLRVKTVNKLGHPGNPADDPDPTDPDDPDEKDSFYCEIVCEVLDWEVRVNDIEF